MISSLEFLIAKNNFIFLRTTRLVFTPLIGADLGRVPIQNFGPIVVDLLSLFGRLWIHVFRRSL